MVGYYVVAYTRKPLWGGLVGRVSWIGRCDRYGLIWACNENGSGCQVPLGTGTTIMA
jgi:hypothetical protein